MRKIKDILRKIGSFRLLQHIVFWLVTYRVLLGIFSGSSEIQKIDQIYTLVFLVTLLIPVYLNLLLFIPLWLSEKKYALFTLAFILAAFGGSLFNSFTFNTLIDYVLPGYYFISFYEIVDILKFVLSLMLLTSLLKLSRGWFKVSEANRKLSQTKKQLLENELLALRSQVNPHFMFNSLNSIYALALKKSDQAPEAIIKLGNILRYVIYETSNEFIELKKEIKMIHDYMNLQNMRSDKPRASFSAEIQSDEIKITPLLFLPLVENGFKHGIKGDKQGFLRIELKQEGDQLIFRTENNRGTPSKVEKEEFKGIGLENIRRRFEISYPGSHEFHIFEDEKIFKTLLKVPIK